MFCSPDCKTSTGSPSRSAGSLTVNTQVDNVNHLVVGMSLLLGYPTETILSLNLCPQAFLVLGRNSRH